MSTDNKPKTLTPVFQLLEEDFGIERRVETGLFHSGLMQTL